MPGMLYVDRDGIGDERPLRRWVDEAVAFADAQPARRRLSRHSRALTETHRAHESEVDRFLRTHADRGGGHKGADRT